MSNDAPEKMKLTTTEVALPAVGGFTAPMLQALTDALGIDRGVLATDAQIQNAWQNLPQLLRSIPLEKRDEGIMRMCVAVASGLFDSAVNYAWNAAIIELREKVRQFGIHIIPQIIDKRFDEQKLMAMQDSELLSLCLKLNLISETGFLMLERIARDRDEDNALGPKEAKDRDLIPRFRLLPLSATGRDRDGDIEGRPS